MILYEKLLYCIKKDNLLQSSVLMTQVYVNVHKRSKVERDKSVLMC